MSESAPNACACSCLLAKQMECWAAGNPIRVEDLLGDCSQGDAEPGCLCELIQAEILLRQASGEQPRRSEYLHRFPVDSPTLYEFLAATTEPEPLDPETELRQLAEGFGDSEHGVAETRIIGRVSAGTSTPDAPEIAGYEIVRCLGHGGVSTAWLARQRSLGREVVLKVLRGDSPDGELAEMLRREARMMAGLNHPQIVQVHDLGEQDGRVYIALEYLPGGSLADRLGPHYEPMPIRAIGELIESVARTLGFVHRQGIVHRDIKPANLLLTQSCAEGSLAETLFGVVKISDFGLSIHLDHADSIEELRTETGCGPGTPIYMAPEQVNGERDALGPEVDVYALGVTLYELLTGQVPYRGETVIETLLQIAEGEPMPLWELRPETPIRLEAICRRCLSHDPGRRYRTGDELADALREYLDEPVTPVTASGWWQRLLGR